MKKLTLLILLTILVSGCSVNRSHFGATLGGTTTTAMCAEAGISNPYEYNDHLNDILSFDGRFYKIRQYHARGRIPIGVVAKITGYEIFIDQEFPFDLGPQHFHFDTLPWPNDCEKPFASDPPPATSIFL